MKHKVSNKWHNEKEIASKKEAFSCNVTKCKQKAADNG